VNSDSTEENMRLLWGYVERHGRPVAFYTDKASLFRTAPKTPRDQQQRAAEEREPLPPTQIGRALQELGIVWIGAHSPQAKGRVERSFQTAQDRLVKGLRVAKVKTREQANRYLEQEFLPWWNQHLAVAPANATDAHRPLSREHDLAASLSIVETRQVTGDYTIRFQSRIYQIARDQIRPGLRHANVRVESRLDESLAVRFGAHYLKVTICPASVRQPVTASIPRSRRSATVQPSAASRAAMDQLLRRPGTPVWRAAEIDRTRTQDKLEP
jgi:hypothetical protein